MPDILSDDDLSPLAAEYVLGTLDSDERTRANVLLDVDHQFRGIVRVWERRLGELHLMVEPVEPDPKVWERIKGKLKDVAPPSLVAVPPQAPAPVPAAEAKSTMSAETGQKLAGLIQEVEKITESAKTSTDKASTDSKPAEPAPEPAKIADAPVADAKLEESTAPKDGESELESKLSETKPESKPEPKLPEAKPFEVNLGIPDDLKIAEPKPAEPKLPLNEPDEPRLPERGSRATPPPQNPELTLEHLREQPGKVKEKTARRGGGGWRAYGVLVTLVAIGLGGLIAAWRYVPDRLPPRLRPGAVLLISEAPAGPVRKPAPPESQFDE
jgi:hypothetical protein